MTRNIYGVLLLHPFTLSVITNLHEFSILEKSGNHQDDRNTKDSIKLEFQTFDDLTIEQQYHFEVFQHLNNLLRAIDRIDEITVYLGQFTNSKTFTKHGITQDKWIHYHYANYTITVLGAFDTVLLLINSVLVLGLQPEKCNYSTISRKLKIQENQFSQLLTTLNCLVEKIRSKRNLYAHRSQFPDLGLLESLESYRLIQEYEKELGIEKEPIIHPIIRDSLYRLERRNLVKSIQTARNQILEVLKIIFDSLETIYSQKM